MTLHIENLSKLRAALSAEGIDVPPYVTEKGLMFIADKHLESLKKAGTTKKSALAELRKRRFPFSANHFSSKTDWIVYLVCQEFRVPRNVLISRSRVRAHVETRYIVMALIRTYTNDSLECIGVLLNRDHTSVIHGIKCFDKDVLPKYKKRIGKIESKIPEYPH